MLSLVGISPAPGEKNVSLSAPVEFTIQDDGTGIDISTLIVEVRGFRAVTNSEFQSGYDGADSVITPSGNNFIVAIDPETDFAVGTVVGIQVQVQDLDGNFFNHSYSFKTIPEEPILIDSNPTNHETFVVPQEIYLEFDDAIDGVDANTVSVSINGLEYISDGVAVASLNGDLTDISTNGTSVTVTIDPIEPLRDGDYLLTYQVADSNSNTLTGKLRFTVKNREYNLPAIFPQTGFLGFFQGIKRVASQGDGNSLLVEWNTPVRRDFRKEVFTLIYENPIRLQVFDQPKYLAASGVLSAIIRDYESSKPLSFAARAVEFSGGFFKVNGMEVVDTGFYRLPSATELVATLEDDGLVIAVESVDGYPEAGFLLIGVEVIRYTAVDRLNHTFSVPTNGRALLNTSAASYLIGDKVELFLRCTDDNTVIITATPTYHDGYASGREINAEGLVVTDFSDNDKYFFQGFDFCGYHQALPQETLTGKNDKDCGSYLGGEFNGLRGFNLYDRMLNREEVLLDQTGEPVILLKRIWKGETCSCMDPRALHPKMRSCENCYGTGFEGGFTQYLNLRREDRRIMVHFNESPEDLLLGDKDHLIQGFEPNGWTLPIPAVKDRDLLLRFDITNDLEFIYEIQNVSREKILFRQYGRQTFTLKRLDKTDVVYTFPFDLSHFD